MALNRVTLMGRFTRDPELRRTTTDIAVVSFTVAVDKPYNKDGEHPEANFIPCVAWRERAELIASHFTKGQRIAIDGTLQSRRYTDNDGNNRSIVEVLVDNVTFVERREKREDVPLPDDPPPVSSKQAAAAPPVSSKQAPAPSGQDGPYTDDDDLPF